jgi:hypothetical protein
MTGFGPRRGSRHDREPGRHAGMDPDALAAAASLHHQAYLDGQRSVTSDPQKGYDLGFDTGYGARNDSGRTWARALMEGHADGMAARQELAEAAQRGAATKQAREAHARIDARQQQADNQPELEAEAG